MKKRLIWIGMALSLSLFAAAFWAFTHPTFAVTQVKDYVARKTGRTLVVNGRAELEFFPRPGLRLNDVYLSNAAGMEGNFSRAKSARIPLQLTDLLSHKLKVREITLVEPVFNFLIDAEGRSSWASGGNSVATSSADEASVKEPIVLLIEGGSANFLDERNGQAFSLEETSARVSIGDDSELDAQGSATLNGQVARIESHIKSIKRISRDGSPLDLTISAPALTVNFTGRLATDDKLSLAGAVDATSPDLHLLAKWLGSEIEGSTGLKNFSLEGALDSKGVIFNLGKASIALDGMVAKGDVALDLTKKVPRIDASLKTDLFILDPYFGASDSGKSDAAPASPGWNTAGLSFNGLKGVDGSLSLLAALVRWNGAEFGPLETSATLRGGKLEAGIIDASLYGGKASANIVLEGARDSPLLLLSLDARAIKGEQFFEEFAGVNWLAGNTDLKASISAAGSNQQEMMSTLNGSFNIVVADGEITGLNIVDIISKVSHALSDGWGKGPENLSAFDTATASFLIKDGIAHSNDVNVESPTYQVSGSGEVDMLRQALDFKFDPALITGDNQATGLAVQVVVKGPWNKPKIYPDVAGILEDPEAAYGTLRGLGVSGKTLKDIGKTGKKLLDNLFGN